MRAGIVACLAALLSMAPFGARAADCDLRVTLQMGNVGNHNIPAVLVKWSWGTVEHRGPLAGTQHYPAPNSYYLFLNQEFGQENGFGAMSVGQARAKFDLPSNARLNVKRISFKSNKRCDIDRRYSLTYAYFARYRHNGGMFDTEVLYRTLAHPSATGWSKVTNPIFSVTQFPVP